MPDDPRFYMDFTGTGNSLNPVHPSVLRLIMDSLRYWAIECHVDGFRFDLASALARELYDVDRLSAFFDVIHQDPVLSQVKLIAEPWDVGPGGYQVGNFPVLWSEWNGIYRDTVRDFWRGAGAPRRFRRRACPGRATCTRPTAATRSRRSTSSPRTTASRSPTSSPTTRSTTRPTSRTTATAPTTTARGTTASRAPTDDPAIRELRARQQRNFLTTLMLSQGTPMLLGGDELGRTQRGNNNAWCQDNEISWFAWELTPEAAAAARVHAPADHAAPRAPRVPPARRSCGGKQVKGSGLPDVWWFRADGRKMTRATGNGEPVLGMFLNGAEILDPGPVRRGDRGRFVHGAVQRLRRGPRCSRCPAAGSARNWVLELSTADPAPSRRRASTQAQTEVAVTSRSILVLRAGRR